jgi:hypothetical protein
MNPRLSTWTRHGLKIVREIFGPEREKGNERESDKGGEKDQ